MKQIQESETILYIAPQEVLSFNSPSHILKVLLQIITVLLDLRPYMLPDGPAAPPQPLAFVTPARVLPLSHQE